MKRFDNSVKGLTVEVNDDFHRSIRTFTKKVQDSGKLRTLKEREFFESPSETKKKQKKSHNNHNNNHRDKFTKIHC